MWKSSPTAPKTFLKYQEFFLDFQQFIETTKFLRFLRTVWNFQECLEIYTNCLRHLESSWHIWELFKNAAKKTLEEEKQWWDRTLALQGHCLNIMQIALAKSQFARGASHLLTFTGSLLTISHMCFSLVTQIVLLCCMTPYDWVNVGFVDIFFRMLSMASLLGDFFAISGNRYNN